MTVPEGFQTWADTYFPRIKTQQSVLAEQMKMAADRMGDKLPDQKDERDGAPDSDWGDDGAKGETTDKAREEAQILIQNAEREIGAAQGRAVAALRKESADLAITLAKRVIGANLDEARSRAVTDDLIRKL